MLQTAGAGGILAQQAAGNGGILAQQAALAGAASFLSPRSQASQRRAQTARSSAQHGMRGAAQHLLPPQPLPLSQEGGGARPRTTAGGDAAADTAAAVAAAAAMAPAAAAASTPAAAASPPPSRSGRAAGMLDVAAAAAWAIKGGKRRLAGEAEGAAIFFANLNPYKLAGEAERAAMFDVANAELAQALGPQHGAASWRRPQHLQRHFDPSSLLVQPPSSHPNFNSADPSSASPGVRPEGVSDFAGGHEDFEVPAFIMGPDEFGRVRRERQLGRGDADRTLNAAAELAKADEVFQHFTKPGQTRLKGGAEAVRREVAAHGGRLIGQGALEGDFARPWTSTGATTHGDPFSPGFANTFARRAATAGAPPPQRRRRDTGSTAGMGPLCCEAPGGEGAREGSRGHEGAREGAPADRGAASGSTSSSGLKLKCEEASTARERAGGVLSEGGAGDCGIAQQQEGGRAAAAMMGRISGGGSLTSVTSSATASGGGSGSGGGGSSGGGGGASGQELQRRLEEAWGILQTPAFARRSVLSKYSDPYSDPAHFRGLPLVVEAMEAATPAFARLSVLHKYSDPAHFRGLPLVADAMEAAARAHALRKRTAGLLRRCEEGGEQLRHDAAFTADEEAQLRQQGCWAEEEYRTELATLTQAARDSAAAAAAAAAAAEVAAAANSAAALAAVTHGAADADTTGANTIGGVTRVDSGTRWLSRGLSSGSDGGNSDVRGSGSGEAISSSGSTGSGSRDSGPGGSHASSHFLKPPGNNSSAAMNLSPRSLHIGALTAAIARRKQEAEAVTRWLRVVLERTSASARYRQICLQAEYDLQETIVCGEKLE
ncbi:hypothetical protein JKP88DRAFT_280728 [Tribonema minus]|uniref:Uncharacterized protein n=1 Tax=Tribonema minus TaxID=303371 RepID=A0A835YQ21_9STRA|nr:hypothetical protein JKP88DRAFT_280728 [Tribonema minus]